MSAAATDLTVARLLGEEGVRRGKISTMRTIEQRQAGNARAMKWLNENRELRNARCKARYYAKKPEIRIIQRRYEQQCAELARAGDKVLHAKALIAAARTRAKRFNVPFDITYHDIPVPEFCPVLGMRLMMNKKSIGPDSATVDRIIPELGYVKCNVLVISLKANVIKNNATFDELMRVAAFYKDFKT